MNQIVKQNGNGALDPAIISSLVIGGDLKGLSNEQRIAYYKYRCQQVGLDPSAKPFDLLTLNGKQVLYANAGCTQQLCQIHGLSPTITDRTIIEGICAVTSRVTGKDGRVTENIGAVPVKGLVGDALANAMMKAVTKAHRRTILAHVGLGMLDETEVETIPGAQMQRGNPLRQEFAALSYELDACKSVEQIDLLLNSPEYADFKQRDAAQVERGGVGFAGHIEDKADAMKKKLPERVEDKRNFVKTVDEYSNAGRESDVAPGEGGSTPPPASPPVGVSEIAVRCMEKFDIVEDADGFKAAQKFATDHQKELTADEKRALNELSRRVGARLRETA